MNSNDNQEIAIYKGNAYPVMISTFKSKGITYQKLFIGSVPDGDPLSKISRHSNLDGRQIVLGIDGQMICCRCAYWEIKSQNTCDFGYYVDQVSGL